MKFLIAVATLLPLVAQDPPPPAAPKPEGAKQAETKQADAKAADAKPAASPVPSGEAILSGSVDFGYRWLTNAGSFSTYRSIVNLGEGPKLIGAEFTILDPAHRWFDRIRVRANNWGDEPSESFHLDADKSTWYRFTADYRDIAYFNFLPSYADPLLSRGVVLSEQSFDTRRKMASFQLDLRPASRIIPYLAFDRNSGSGSGVTAFITDANEFPVPNSLHDRTDLYRGGVRIELGRFHATLEQGGTAFRDDQTLYSSGTTNPGNVANNIFGQRITLTNLLAGYGVRGNSIYSKALMTAAPTSWLDVYGQFLFSQPKAYVNYHQSDAVNLLLQSQLFFYNSQAYLLSATSKLPHTTGSLGAEIRPLHKLRLIESWTTDRLHNTGSAASNQTFTSPTASQQIAALLSSSLVTNYNQAQVDLLYDLTAKVVLRGGYRYVWGDANDAVAPLSGLASADRAKIRRNVGLGAITFRPSQRISVTAEAEKGSSGGTYFRTSLYDYEKVRAQARSQATKTLSVAADFIALVNDNPVPGVKYDYRSQQQSLSLSWNPSGSLARLGDLQGSYTRATVSSDIGYLAPQDLSQQNSHYRDDAHIATALWNVKLPVHAKLTAGGSFVINSGSRRTEYYQPLATLFVPFGKHAAWFTEWRYYGYGEAFYFYEAFRAHLVTTGLRLSR